jgi:uncharacterized protein YkwD
MGAVVAEATPHGWSIRAGRMTAGERGGREVRRAAFLVALALAIAACNLSETDDSGSGSAAGDLAATRESLAPLAETLLVRINHDRDVLGLPAFTPSQALVQVAGLRVEDMLVRGYLGSIGPGDATVAAQDLMGAAGYRGRLGELIYEYNGQPESLVDTTISHWMASEAHRDLLLEAAFEYVGVGLIGDGKRWIIAAEFAEQGP